MAASRELPAAASVVICGAGMAGVAAAWHLAVRRGVPDVLLVDERAPLTLTSDKSTECYRNWWAGPDGAMVALMNRSIDLLEELADGSGNAFNLNRRGYVYATADPARVGELEAAGRLAEAQGAGQLRIHADAAHATYTPAPAEGYRDQPTGADLITAPELIRRHFPSVTGRAVALLHARRCGWFSGQQLGMLLLEQAREHGARFHNARVEGVDLRDGRVAGVRLNTAAGPHTVATPCFVNAAGPYLNTVARMLGVELPVSSEPHLKVSFQDARGTIPRDAPMLIWIDPQRLGWSEAERADIAREPHLRPLLEEMPPGPHARPEGGADARTVLTLWTYHDEAVAEPVYPLTVPPHYAEVVLRGMSAMLPDLGGYLERLPRVYIDGGYYTKTRENRLLCGPHGVEGAYVVGALSGYGMMAACAAGELLAAHLTRGPLPHYASAFALSRYDDPAYRAAVEHWDETGQL